MTPGHSFRGCALQGVGLDLDGTLMDHAASADAAVRAWAVERGWPQDQTAVAWVRAEQEHFPHFTNGRITFQEQRRRRVRDTLLSIGQDPHEYDADLLFSGYLVHYERSWSAYPDAAPFLRALREAGLRVGVLTNGQREQQESKLRVIGLMAAVDSVVASSDLPAGKPDPRAFAALCTAMGTARETTLYIGDDIHADVSGAAAAGLPALWLNRCDAPDEVPYPQASNLNEALNWLDLPSRAT